MSDFDWTLAVGGDLDIAINDNTRRLFNTAGQLRK